MRRPPPRLRRWKHEILGVFRALAVLPDIVDWTDEPLAGLCDRPGVEKQQKTGAPGMTQKSKPRAAGAVSPVEPQKANVRIKRKIRAGRGSFMGMEVLILDTVGQPQRTASETPCRGCGRRIVASSCGSRHLPLARDLMAHPDRPRSSYLETSRRR